MMNSRHSMFFKISLYCHDINAIKFWIHESLFEYPQHISAHLEINVK